MKKYKTGLMVLSAVFGLALFMLVYGAVYDREATAKQDYGLPGEYIALSVGCSENWEDITGISDKVLDVIKGNEDIIALFDSPNNNAIYLYDPSGYYSGDGILGNYFSWEDFLKSDGGSALIYEGSAYSLMEEDGSVYALNKDINVIGTYSREYPLYKYGNKRTVISDFSFSDETSGKLYLANCDQEMEEKVREVFLKNGWYAENMKDKHYYYYDDRAESANLLPPLITLCIMALAIAVNVSSSAFKAGICFAGGIRRGIIPIAAGCSIVAALGLGVIKVVAGEVLLNAVIISLGASLGLMLILISIGWIVSCLHAKGGLLKRTRLYKGYPSDKASIVGLMLLVCITSSYVSPIKYQLTSSLKELPYKRSMEAYDIVAFNNSYIRNGLSYSLEYTDKIGKEAIDIIKDGRAYAFISSRNVDLERGILVDIALGPFLKMSGLEEPKAQFSCLINKSTPGVKIGDVLNIDSVLEPEAPQISSTVQGYLPENMYLRIAPGQAGYHYSDGLITMDAEEYEGLHKDLSAVVEGLCFINPDKDELKEYMNLLISEGFTPVPERWRGQTEGEAMKDFSIILSRGIVGLALTALALVLIINVLRRALESKKDEYKLRMLYGAASGSMIGTAFLIAFLIIVPGMLLSTFILPVQYWLYFGSPNVYLTFIGMPALKYILQYGAIGSVAAIILALVSLGIRGQFSTICKI